MNKLNTFAAIIKFINGSNKGSQYMQGVYDYITDPVKTDNGLLVATQGCSLKHPLKDIYTHKKMRQKTHGKQGEHFVLALAPIGAGKSPVVVLNAIEEIVATVYPQYMAVIAVHTDSKFIHGHVLLDAVNAVTGRKFSQSPSDLNRVKQQANNILKKHGFEIITASANEFVDHNDYSKEEGFDFLELDESQFITETMVEEIDSYTDSAYTEDPLDDWFYPSWTNNHNGGNHMNNNYTRYVPHAQTMSATETSSTPTKVEIVPSSTPVVRKSQKSLIPAPAVETVPTTVGNSYPNTSVVTGPTFRIKGTPESNFAGLNELVEQTTAYAQEHQHEAANLALGMQQASQQKGFQTNINVISGPIFDIDLTGGMYPSLPGDDEIK